MTSLDAAHQVRALVGKAIVANCITPGREGNVVDITHASAEDVMITGDLHGHVENYRRILQIADLEANPRRHLIMQEVCHGGPKSGREGCGSYRMLLDVIQMKTRYPTRFHFLLSNHELSELTGHPIAKNGKLVSLTFLMGITEEYGDSADEVHNALAAFVASCPIAIRIGSQVVATHSIPEMKHGAFDVGVFRRGLRQEDLADGGDVFRMVWGRDFSEENARAFAQLTGAHTLVNGHVPCAEGYNRPNHFQIVLDCCGTPASYMLLDLTNDGGMRDPSSQVHLL